MPRATICALQTTKDELMMGGNKCHLVPIGKDFIKKGALAFKSYTMRQEEE